MSDVRNITEAILSLQPNTQFRVRTGFDDITWIEGDAISKADIETEVSRLQAEYDANQYQRDRQYPDLGEQLDMLFHDMTAGKGSKDGEWYKAIAKVKADNPKG